ncbi:ABC transporter permease [Rhodopila sp.]|jgi:iron(III) transport system permease protein|uniref:ABC transporter permease n=1 Tax=Rhodopila sp. TaxID=2480087 RepID=UPI002B7E2A16|nr:iron ABC transporter permease [Rhodopila sp.]HVZ10070.1 iron ABC transporter permease [Rhodopila sp.]
MSLALSSGTRIRRFDPSLVPLALAGLFLAMLVLLPLGWLLAYTLSDEAGRPSWTNLMQLADPSLFWEPFVTTFGIALGVAALACAIAVPLAWLVARTDVPGRRLLRGLVMVSFITPPFIGAVAWVLLAAPNSGLLNQYYRWITGAGAFDSLFNIFSTTGIIFVMGSYAFPYVFVLVANTLDRLPYDLEEASAILGGGRWHTFRRVTLPMVLPALLAGFLIAFLQAMTQFGTPAILALPAGFHVLTTKIWSLFQFPPKTHLAAACAMPLLLVTILLLRAEKLLLGRRGYTMVGGKSGTPRLTPLGLWRWPALLLALFILFSTVLLPNLVLIRSSMLRSIADPWTWQTITWANVPLVFGLTNTLDALRNTLVTGVAAATLGSVFAVLIAYLTARKAVPGHQVLGFLATAPVAIPGIVLGVALFIAYTRPPFQLYGTLWILLLAFLTIEMPPAYQQMQAAFRGLNPELEEASRILGAGRLTSLAKVVAPLLKTSVAATWCFIFIGAIRELSATILLTTSQTKLVSVLIYDLNESGALGGIAVLGLVLMAVTAVVVVIANRVANVGVVTQGR